MYDKPSKRYWKVIHSGKESQGKHLGENIDR